MCTLCGTHVSILQIYPGHLTSIIFKKASALTLRKIELGINKWMAINGELKHSPILLFVGQCVVLMRLSKQTPGELPVCF